jgi:hypothetical protein
LKSLHEEQQILIYAKEIKAKLKKYDEEKKKAEITKLFQIKQPQPYCNC